jgi:hypothetical protein
VAEGRQTEQESSQRDPGRGCGSILWGVVPVTGGQCSQFVPVSAAGKITYDTYYMYYNYYYYYYYYYYYFYYNYLLLTPTTTY